MSGAALNLPAGAADDIVTIVTEDFLGCLIEVRDAKIAVHREDTIGHAIEDGIRNLWVVPVHLIDSLLVTILFLDDCQQTLVQLYYRAY